MFRRPTALAPTLLLTGSAIASDEAGGRVSAEIDAGLYGETGRLDIRLAFTAREALTERYQVLLHNPLTGVVDRRADGGRPAVLVLVALVERHEDGIISPVFTLCPARETKV